MDCSRRIEQISALVDKELTGRKRAELEAHLAVCEECSKVYADFVELKATIQSQDLHSGPSPAFWGRFQAALDAEDARGRGFVFERLMPRMASALATLLVIVVAGLLLFHPDTEAPVDASMLARHHYQAFSRPELLSPVGNYNFQCVNSTFTSELNQSTGPANKLSNESVGVLGAGFWHYKNAKIPFLVFRKGNSPCTLYTLPRRLISLDKMDRVKLGSGEVLYRSSCGGATILATEVNAKFVAAAVSCMPEAEMEQFLGLLAD